MQTLPASSAAPSPLWPSSTVAPVQLARVRPAAGAIAGSEPRGGRGWTATCAAAVAGVASAGVATAARRRQRQRQQRQRLVAIGRRPYELDDVIIYPTIWSMLNLDPDRDGREEIRKSYKEFILREHPDTRSGTADPEFLKRFEMITTEYKNVMKTDDDGFWFAKFNAQVMQREKRKMEYRQARTDYRVYAKQLELKEQERQIKEMTKVAQEQGLPLAGEGQGKTEEGLRPDQIVGYAIVGGGGALMLTFASILASN